MTEFATPQPGGTVHEATPVPGCTLYPEGPATNQVTQQLLPTILDCLQESPVFSMDDLHSAMRTTDLEQCIADLAPVLAHCVGPAVTPASDDSAVGDDRDALALAMYRGHVDWPAVADAVYWTAYVGEPLEYLLGDTQMIERRNWLHRQRQAGV